MRLSVVRRSLRELIEHINVPLIKIPTNKYEEIVTNHKVSSHALKENQRKLSDMSQMIHDVLMSQNEDKSKHFMDLKMLYPFQEVMKQYNNIKLAYGPTKIPPNQVIVKFLKDFFEEDNDIEVWSPPDWVSEPKAIKSIKDPGFKKLANHINRMWVKLGRKTNENIRLNRDRHSITYVKNGFIVTSPGLEEMIYWDSYWIVRGLLVCEMFSTVKGIIENFIFLLEQYGCVPKSNRIYHQEQTQIPMLIMMMDEYLQHTSDHTFLKENIQTLEKELLFWKSQRILPVTVNNSVHNLYRYLATRGGPRPEYYKSDYIYLSTQIQVSTILSGLRAAEQSCWARSSRWIDLLGENEGTVTDIATEHIIPVDLNAVLHKNMEILSRWYRSLGDDKKTAYYKQAADELQQSIYEVLWQRNLGFWCDYNFATSEPRRYHYLSNFTPIWTRSHREDPKKLSSSILQYISDHKLHEYQGGLPVSMEFSGEPWDFPNVQSSEVAIFLEGLASLGDAGTETAFLLAEMWLDSVYKGFVDKQHIYNKYSCLKMGELPDDSEEPILTGFGITNGVIMSFLAKWGNILRSSSQEINPKEGRPGTK